MGSMERLAGEALNTQDRPPRFLYFFPLPQTQGSLRPIFADVRTGKFKGVKGIAVMLNVAPPPLSADYDPPPITCSLSHFTGQRLPAFM
jgi:hypothetical protein